MRHGTGTLHRLGGSGFTLAELLVGMIIGSMVLGGAAGVFVTTMDGWTRADRKYRLQQAANTTGDVIERFLRSAVSPEDARSFIFEGEDLSDSEVDGHRLIFLSAASARLPRAEPPTDMSEVEFGFDPSKDDALNMRIDTTPDDELDAGGLDVTLTPLIKSFKVLYFDGSDWVNEWYEDSLPKAVEFHLTLAEGEETSSKGGKGAGSGPGSQHAPGGSNSRKGATPSLETVTISRLVVFPIGEESGWSSSGLLDEVSSGRTNGSASGGSTANSNGRGQR